MLVVVVLVSRPQGPAFRGLAGSLRAVNDLPKETDHVCTVCSGPMTHFDTGVVLAKYAVRYLRCEACGLIALREPTWLDEAYANAIFDGDLGLLRRGRVMSRVTSALIRSEGLRRGKFLDWAGGYGTFTRMMRDKGFDYYTTDAYAQNFLAPGFEGDVSGTYDLVTAFEVLEHLEDPYAELEKLAASNDRLFFTTELQPAEPPMASDWWYYTPDSGQHITFFTHPRQQLAPIEIHTQLTLFIS